MLADTDLIEKIESFLEKTGWTKTKFGREALSDPNFVFDLESGRDIRGSTRARVVAFIKSNTGAGERQSA